MSWAEIKKAINSDLSTPLNEQLGKSGIEVFTSDGTFTVPAGVSTVFVTMYDGGGAGSNGANGGAGGGANGGAGGATNGGYGGGGGAGGYTIQKPLSVIAGQVYDVVVGLGGSTSGATGGTSSISLNGDTVLVTDKQGAKGGNAGSSAGGAGTSGGDYGAGGGGGAGGNSSGAGGAGGAYGLGGAGGASGGYANNGRSGGAYGAGGGGCAYATAGAGSQGIVVISWGASMATVENLKMLLR